jgi:GT2 family glycosyltransferase
MLDNISFPQQHSSIARNQPPKRITDEFANTCIVFRKDVFDTVGYYDEEFLFYGADKEWAWRFLRSRTCIGYLRPDVIVNHLSHYSAKKAVSKKEFNSLVEGEYAESVYLEKTN